LKNPRTYVPTVNLDLTIPLKTKAITVNTLVGVVAASAGKAVSKRKNANGRMRALLILE
jgi:hypothetical protein